MSYSSNLPKKIEALQGLYSVNSEAKLIASNKIGSFLITKVRDFIENDGEGTWEKTHPLTLNRRNETAYFWLGKMARYKIGKGGSKLEIGFGQFTKRDVKKGKDLNFDKKLSKVSKIMQLGKSFRVTNRMRRYFGSFRKNRKSRAGIDFFPVRKRTRRLYIPPRPVMMPVMSKYRTQILNIYDDKYKREMYKRFERL